MMELEAPEDNFVLDWISRGKGKLSFSSDYKKILASLEIPRETPGEM